MEQLILSSLNTHYFKAPGFNFRLELELWDAEIRFDYDNQIVLKDGKPIYKIILKYGKNGNILKPIKLAAL